jgi:hypothetical protein
VSEGAKSVQGFAAQTRKVVAGCRNCKRRTKNHTPPFEIAEGAKALAWLAQESNPHHFFDVRPRVISYELFPK